VLVKWKKIDGACCTGAFLDLLSVDEEVCVQDEKRGGVKVSVVDDVIWHQ